MTTTNVVPIRVSGPSGLLAAVPPMLGFHPTNSLVLMCLKGNRRRIGPVARVDLPAGRDHATALHLANHAVNHADEVVVICYQKSRRRPPLLDDLLAELARLGVDVMDAIVVRAGRARPALNAHMERAHPGIPVPAPDDPQVRALTAAGALAGRSVLADRRELRRSIAGPTGSRLRQAERAVAEAAAGRIPAARNTEPERAPSAPDGRLSRMRALADADELAENGLAQIATTGQVAVDIAAALAVMMTDVRVRDAVLTRAIVELDRPWLPMLIACATWTPDYLAPPLCAVLAAVAYRHGDGALAQVSVDRCLAVEPHHRLAHLMVATMAAGLRPQELERIATDHITMDDAISDQSTTDKTTDQIATNLVSAGRSYAQRSSSGDFGTDDIDLHTDRDTDLDAEPDTDVGADSDIEIDDDSELDVNDDDFDEEDFDEEDIGLDEEDIDLGEDDDEFDTLIDQDSSHDDSQTPTSQPAN